MKTAARFGYDDHGCKMIPSHSLSLELCMVTVHEPKATAKYNPPTTHHALPAQEDEVAAFYIRVIGQ